MALEILVAEDDSGDAFLLQEAFKLNAPISRLHLVRDGFELMSFVHRQGKFACVPRPDVILLDLHMPRKSGFEVLDELKSDKGFRSIPVIVFSTSTAQEHIARCCAMHANGFLAKPPTMHELADIIDAIHRFWSLNLRS
jgi:CheY-like chemotaxis protein